MSRRLEQLNEQLRKELANLIMREIPITNSIITVCYVDCSPDLSQAKIAISILPDNLSNQLLEKVKKHSSQFCQILRKKMKIRQIPRFNWIIDNTEKNAAEIEKTFKQIKSEKSNNS